MRARDRQHTGESTGAKQYMMDPVPGGAGAHYKISRMPLAFPNRPQWQRLQEVAIKKVLCLMADRLYL